MLDMRNGGAVVCRTLLLLLMTCLANPSRAQAAPSVQMPVKQDAPSLSLAPAVIQASGQPGQSFTQTLTINNQTGMSFNFEMVAQDVVVREGKRVFVGAGEVPHSIAATAVFSKREVQVGPSQTASVDVTVTLPPETPLRAMVAIFRGTDRISNGGSGLGMTASLGTLITFTASQDFQLHPEPLKIDPQSESRPLVFKQLLANTGAEPFIAEGVLALLAHNGALVGKVKFPAQRLLPGEESPFEAEYGSLLPAGHYRALATYQFEGRTLTSSSEFDVP